MSTMSVADPRFETEARGYGEQPPQKRSKWMPCLIGCGIVVLGGILLAAIAGFWLYRNIRPAAAAIAEQAMNEGINSSELPQQEKDELKAEAKRAIDAFRDGRMSMEQLGQLAEGFAQSPLMTLFMVTALEKQYLDNSGLSEGEKKEGRITLQRFVRGAADKKIDQQGIDAVMAHVADKKADGTWQVRQKVSDESLRAALAEAKAQADDAGVEESPPEFDPSDELKKVIDEVLGPPGGAEPAAEMAAPADGSVDVQDHAEPAEELK